MFTRNPIYPLPREGLYKGDLHLGYIDDIIFIWKNTEEGLKIL